MLLHVLCTSDVNMFRINFHVYRVLWLDFISADMVHNTSLQVIEWCTKILSYARKTCCICSCVRHLWKWMLTIFFRSTFQNTLDVSHRKSPDTLDRCCHCSNMCKVVQQTKWWKEIVPMKSKAEIQNISNAFGIFYHIQGKLYAWKDFRVFP